MALVLLANAGTERALAIAVSMRVLPLTRSTS
jgi:hypothetical protein